MSIYGLLLLTTNVQSHSLAPLRVSAVPISKNNASQAAITIKCVGEPLTMVLRKMSDQANVELTADRDIADTKLFCVVRDRPVEEVRARLSELLCAKWVTQGDPQKRSMRLERDPEIKSWLEFYARERAFAEK